MLKGLSVTGMAGTGGGAAAAQHRGPERGAQPGAAAAGRRVPAEAPRAR